MARRKNKPRSKKGLKKSNATKSNLPIDQFEDMNGWLNFYKENKKFPHNRVLCCLCHQGFASLKGIGLVKAFEKCDNNPSRVLSETKCKDCKALEPKQKKQPKILTPEEQEARAEEIRKNLPKINFYKERIVIDLTKDKDACIFYTSTACVRPDIYLDNDRTCDHCSINKNCACPIKKFSKEYIKKHERRR